MNDLDKFIIDLQHFLAAGNYGADAVIYSGVARSLLLAIQIADECSVSDIESTCEREKVDDNLWYHIGDQLDREQRDPEEIRLVAQALDHLRNRGMLIEHTAHNWVRIVPARTPLP